MCGGPRGGLVRGVGRPWASRAGVLLVLSPMQLGARGLADHPPSPSSWDSKPLALGLQRESRRSVRQELLLALASMEGTSQTHPSPADCWLVSSLPCNRESSFQPLPPLDLLLWATPPCLCPAKPPTAPGLASLIIPFLI